MTAFVVHFEYSGGAPEAKSEILRMFQHPIKGDIIHKQGLHYDVKSVIYDMSREQVTLKCEYRGEERF